MSTPETVRFLLEEPLRQSAVDGRHNFIAKVANVLENASISVEYLPEYTRSEGYSLRHMSAPNNKNGLVFRRVYHYPFWQIEQTAERWNWDTATADFDPREVDARDAKKFYHFWQKRLWGDLAKEPRKDGYVYVPLQGRLLSHRSFQHCSPVEMIEACLAGMPNKSIIATLHPNEQYTDPELSYLNDLRAKHPRLKIRTGEMEELLQGCDCIVTQNSSAAFNGYFFGKPALLFAKIDFHHIAITADMTGLQSDFAKLETHAPDYAAYVYWFWQLRSINAGHPTAEAKIATRLRRFGWPV